MAFSLPKLTPQQITLGITAIGAIAAIWYYRQSIAAAQGTNQDTAPAPLFQTAAIPSFTSGTSGGGVAATGTAADSGGAVAGSGLTSADISGLVQSQLAASGQATLATSQAGSAVTFETLQQPLISQLIAQLPPIFPGDASSLSIAVNGTSPAGPQHLDFSANLIAQGTPLPVYQPPPPTPLPTPPPPIIIQNTFQQPQPPVVGFDAPPAQSGPE